MLRYASGGVDFMTHIYVKANPPYVALIDGGFWRTKVCEAMRQICSKPELFVQHLVVQRVESGACLRCFNAHMPTSFATPERKRSCVVKMCEVATPFFGSGVAQPTAIMPWVIGGDCNVDEGTMKKWCHPFVQSILVPTRFPDTATMKK